MNAIAGRIAELHPSEQKEWTRVGLMPLDRYLTLLTSRSQVEDRMPRMVLFGIGALLVLLVAAANVATLVLARGYARSGELAVRAALGAGRGRLVRSLFVETALLAMVGSGLALGLAVVVIGAVQRASPDLLPRLGEVPLDLRAALVALALALATTVVAGLWPAFRVTRETPLGSLLADGNRSGEAPARRSARTLLVGFQVAMATMLLAGAGVLHRSFQRVVDQPRGFAPDQLASVSVWPPRDRYATPESLIDFYQRLTDGVGRLPEVVAVGFSNQGRLATRVTIPGRQPDPDRPDEARYWTISPNYFAVLGIPIVAGRGFSAVDLAGPSGGLMVNQAFARRYWPDEDPIGRPLTVAKAARWLPDFGQPINAVVIGVVGDVRPTAETEPGPEVYLPYSWNPWQWTELVVRTRGDPAAARDPIRRTMLAVEPELPMASSSGWLGFRTFDQAFAEERSAQRFTTVAIGVLSVFTLVLAALGLYAVIALVVASRRREIGIRMALGSGQPQVVRMVLREALVLIGSGALIGLVAAWFGMGLLEGLVFGIAARDLITFIAVPILLSVVALGAVAVPILRAATVPPAEALR
jgi:predicted permease